MTDKEQTYCHVGLLFLTSLTKIDIHRNKI